MFIAAILKIARTWKQAKCQFTDKWVKKLWYIYTMQCYSDIKRNKCELVLVSWMNLESVIQTEVNKKERNKYHINAYTGCREKTALMNLFAWQKLRCRHTGQICGQCEKERAGQIEKVA